MGETGRRREKQEAYNKEHGITPASVKAHIADIMDSMCEKDHVRADISGFAESGAMIGNNLAAHLESLEKKMRDAAADLDFEEAARLRDEVKRLRETELAVMDDPLARLKNDMDASPKARREKKAKPRGPLPRSERGGDYFKKPELGAMGPGTDVARPVGSGKLPSKPGKKDPAADAGPLNRGKIGAGSYEDPAEQKRKKMTRGKTGKPGH